jgi:2-aminoethylphosphonate-pyruvate transaminase
MAGWRGSRLKEKTVSMPEGFVEVGGVPIIKRSVKNLFSAGGGEIIVGTGRCAGWFERFEGGVRLVHNARYAKTGGMGTLACCAPFVKGDFLPLESDLIYAVARLCAFINERRENVVLAKESRRIPCGVIASGRDGRFRRAVGTVYWNALRKIQSWRTLVSVRAPSVE